MSAMKVEQVGAGPYLRLLFEEAPAEAFEAPLLRAREAGASEAELERLQADMVLALQIRATLAERRRRESELAALNETAADLTAIRDHGRVLQAIVRRARNLLGTDTSYLTLIDDERGDTYMRVTEGIVTAAFRELRLELGMGLGGLVAQTRNAYATPSYAADARFAHTPTIDDAVAGEGLTAILGVPILLGERVIGVLFAADRRERSFTPQQVALLSAFAAHAAVAIENARLFQEAEQALRELNDANAVISAHSHAVERAAAAHERLTRIVLAGGGVPELAAAVAELFAGSIVVVGSDGRTAGSGGQADATWLEQRLQGEIDGAASSGRTSRARTERGACWIAPVLAGTEHLGALVLWPQDELTAADLRTLERAGQATALLLLNQRSVAEAEQRVRGELLSDLVRATEADVEGLHQRALLLGSDLGRPHAVVVAAAPTTSRHRTASVAAALAGDLGGLAGGHQGEVVLLLPASDAGEAAAAVARRLSAALGDKVTAGGAGPADGPLAVAAAYDEARRCLHVLQALGRTGDAATAADLGAYSLLLGRLDQVDVERFIAHTIGPLVAYDRQRGTRLVETLAVYFAHGGNLARTSGALHIHVNTLYQRMDRIGQLIGADWQEADRALQLHLAVRLDGLRSAV